MNNVVLIGRFVRDLELKFLPGSGMAVTKGTLAVDRKAKKDGPKEADFISITAFGKTAESIASYCGSKGDLICIQGHIQTGKYEDKNGITHYTTEVIVDGTQFLNPKKSNNTAPVADNSDEMTPVEDGDIPF